MELAGLVNKQIEQLGVWKIAAGMIVVSCLLEIFFGYYSKAMKKAFLKGIDQAWSFRSNQWTKKLLCDLMVGL